MSSSSRAPAAQVDALGADGRRVGARVEVERQLEQRGRDGEVRQLEAFEFPTLEGDMRQQSLDGAVVKKLDEVRNLYCSYSCLRKAHGRQDAAV